MTSIQVPAGQYQAVYDAIRRRGLPLPVEAETGDDGVATFVWAADLTQAQRTVVADAMQAQRMGVSPDLFAAIKPELPIQRQYAQMLRAGANPTAAQRGAWELSVVRILRALLLSD